MSAKTLDDLRMVDPVLTNLAAGFKNPALAADKIFPIIEVAKHKGKIPVFGKEAFAVYETERAVRGPSNRVAPPGAELIEFETRERDIESAVDYLEVDEADDNLRYEQKIASDLMDVLMLGREKEIADYLQDSGNYSADAKTNLTSVNAFSNYESSTSPISVINDAREAVRNRIARYPNIILMGPTTFRALKEHPVITNLLKYTDLPIPDEKNFARIFGVQEVIVGNAVYSPDSTTFSDVWGDMLLLAYVDRSDVPSEFNPSCGYTFRREGMPEVDTYYENGGKIKVIRCTDNYGSKVTAPDALHLISNTCNLA